MKMVETKINMEDSTKKKSLRQRLMEWTGINAIPINHRISAAEQTAKQKLHHAKAMEEKEMHNMESLLQDFEILEFKQLQAARDPIKMREIEKKLLETYAHLTTSVAICEFVRNRTGLLETATAKISKQADAQKTKGYQLLKTYLLRQASTPVEMVFSLVYGAYEALVGKDETRNKIKGLSEQVSDLPLIIEYKKQAKKEWAMAYKDAEEGLKEVESAAKKCKNLDDLETLQEMRALYLATLKRYSAQGTEASTAASRCETMLSERVKILSAITKAKHYLSRAS